MDLARGPDGVEPQHLKDMICPSANNLASSCPQPICAVGFGRQSVCPLEALLFWCQPHCLTEEEWGSQTDSCWLHLVMSGGQSDWR